MKAFSSAVVFAPLSRESSRHFTDSVILLILVISLRFEPSFGLLSAGSAVAEESKWMMECLCCGYSGGGVFSGWAGLDGMGPLVVGISAGVSPVARITYEEAYLFTGSEKREVAGISRLCWCRQR